MLVDIKEVISIFNKKELTKEKLNEIIDENMKVWWENVTKKYSI